MCNIVPAGFVVLYNPESEIELMAEYDIAPLLAFSESLALHTLKTKFQALSRAFYIHKNTI